MMIFVDFWKSLYGYAMDSWTRAKFPILKDYFNGDDTLVSDKNAIPLRFSWRL